MGRPQVRSGRHGPEPGRPAACHTNPAGCAAFGGGFGAVKRVRLSARDDGAVALSDGAVALSDGAVARGRRCGAAISPFCETVCNNILVNERARSANIET